MKAILPIGRYLPKDSAGNLVNDCREEHIVSPWKETVDETVQAYLDVNSDQIHGIYLRGSIPRGLALPGSDVDTMVIVRAGAPGLSSEWIPKFLKSARNKFPFVSHFEFNAFRHDEIMQQTQHFNTRFVLKTLSLCLWGQDISSEISPFKPSLKLGISFHGNIENEIKSVKTEFKKATSSSRCVWIMKRMLRTGLCLVLDKEREFTRDLYLCWETFSKHYPQKSSAMKQALEWAVNPSLNSEEIVEYLDEFGSWLSREAHKVFFGYGQND